MNDSAIGRREFLQATGLAALGAAAFDPQASLARGSAQPVPNSSGTAAPKLKAPANACDCHMHIYDGQRFAPPRPESRMQADARVSDYRLLQKRIGTRRTVVVSPAAYGTDNRVTLDAIAQLGNARGVAVVHPVITDAELKAFAAGGIRASAHPGRSGVSPTFGSRPPKRVNDLGWHVQIHMRADQITAAGSLGPPPCPIVFDHRGACRNPPASPGVQGHAGADRQGRTWVKISGAYLNTKIGPPTYADATKVAQAFVQSRGAWCGAATGRIRMRASRRSRTTPCCSTCSRSGRRTRR